MQLPTPVYPCPLNLQVTGCNTSLKNIIIAAPLGLVEEDYDDNQYKAPNLLRRVLSLMTNLKPGASLISFQLPPEFNIPKSMLQVYGETTFCVGKEMLNQCNAGKDPIERMTAILAWKLSTLRSLAFGVAPYNPILGETHHVSRGTLNVLLEQVSHHPPITALHATDSKNGIEMIWCLYSVPKFVGNGVETHINGTREIRLLNKGENYLMNHPKLLIRFLPVPSVLWSGNITVSCAETGLEACLTFGGSFLLGINPRSVKGKICLPPSKKPLYEINGRWDGIVTAKEVSTGTVRVIYDAKEVLSGLKPPFLEDPEGICESDSVIVWKDVNEGIMKRRWEEAREVKNMVEEKEREIARERKRKGEIWKPKHFSLSFNKDDNTWNCSPLHQSVPRAPLVVPIQSNFHQTFN
ncbi:oxysterol-binding protein-related protein 4C-like [Impatiens glandulifera]|uniref:oxysterol-binding protein-related protein 4C-like n=1 Tax=Impatiens glandulifera TaxID=253017 RepID=UPI001FB0CBE2|nr:oxysterol-binding protein-related protein 4C-like [Impatiens glandulifera]